MTRAMFRLAAVGLLLAGSAPVLADAPPPPPPPAGMMGDGGPGGPEGGPPRHGGRWGRGHEPFASLSEAGRATMREAFKGGGDRKADHEAVAAARDRMLAVLDADRLDTGALKRAMDDERNAVNASRERQQAAMLAGFSKLSVADRKAFVADARALKARMAARVDEWRSKRRPGGPDGDMPPPPPPQ